MADFTNLLGDTNEDENEDLNVSINYPENNQDNDDDNAIEVNVPHILDTTTHYEEEDETSSTLGKEDSEYKMLKDLWIQEICCPEILPYDHDTISLHMELLDAQEDAIEKLISSSSSNNEQDNNSINDPILTSFEATVYRMDLERIKFVMEDYTRIRLKKMEEYPFYTPNHIDRLSQEEEVFLNSYIELVTRHFNRTVLNDIKKDAFSKLDDKEMIDAPDFDEYVFCRVKESIVIAVGDDEEDGTQDYSAGTCLVAKYKLVRDFILEGKVELML